MRIGTDSWRPEHETTSYEERMAARDKGDFRFFPAWRQPEQRPHGTFIYDSYEHDTISPSHMENLRHSADNTVSADTLDRIAADVHGVLRQATFGELPGSSDEHVFAKEMTALFAMKAVFQNPHTSVPTMNAIATVLSHYARSIPQGTRSSVVDEIFSSRRS